MLLGLVAQEVGKDGGDGVSLLHGDCNSSWKNLKAGDDSVTEPWSHSTPHLLPGLTVDVS